jgi:HAE1 family hydrophobic/amphiphilic exporter-1
MTKIAIRRPVTTLMAILILISFGAMSLANLQMDLLPNMNIPVAVVVTSYVGASPDQIQSLVTEPIEQSLATIAGLDTIMSTSSENMSAVILQFQQNVDLDLAALDMREAVDRVKGWLPEDASDPMVMKMDINSMITIEIVVSSSEDDLASLQSKVNNRVIDRLIRQPGVASAIVYGGREKEIRVDVIEDRMRGFGVSEQQISGLLRAENSSMPVGSIRDSGRNLTIKVDGQFQSIEEIRNIPVQTPFGGIVYIRDLAHVYETYADASLYAVLNGEPAVVLTIQKQSDANTVNVSRAVARELENIRRDFPELTISTIIDPADYIEFSINAVASNAVIGVILAVIVLFIFLRNIRSTLVIASAIPVSIMVTFAFMYFAGMTMNLMSLGGLTLGVGLLIDNSIVVLESVFRRMEEGEERIRAALNGTREVAMSIVTSTLTTVAVFVPVAWVGGLIAQVFNDLALTIGFSLMSSLAVALTFVPLACSLFLVPTGTFKRRNFIVNFLQWIGRGFDRLDRGYRRALRWATSHRKTIWTFSIVFFLGTMVSLAFIGWELMPAADQSMITIDVRLPIGAVIERTEDITDQIMEKLDGIPGIKDSIGVIGQGGGMGFGTSSHRATIYVTLVPMAEREYSSTAIADVIRGRMDNIAGARITVEALTSMMGMGGMGGGADIQYQIKGDDIFTLIDVADRLVELMADVPGIRDARSSVGDTIPQATIRVDRPKASAMGLSAGMIMGVVNTSVSGTSATAFRTSGDEINIRVGAPDSLVRNLDDLGGLLIPSPLGMSVPLREVADIEITQSPISINRENQVISVSVSASLDGTLDLGSVSGEINNRIQSRMILPVGVAIDTGGNQQMMDEEIMNMFFAFILAIVLVYAIMAAEFESLYYPFIVMGSLPLAVSAGIAGLHIMGQTINIVSALGLIVLVGIVTNNAIVLVDYINLLRGKGLGLFDAVLTAGPVRLRAILMTTVTTVLALLPMLLGSGEGSEMMRPLATVAIWGLSISTLITLFVIPAVYITFENIRTKMLGERKRFREIEEV